MVAAVEAKEEAEDEERQISEARSKSCQRSQLEFSWREIFR